MKHVVSNHGQHIFAYCHVRTNQVLYSLTKTLLPSALKQLPDAGANNTPPSLRKDLWKPLYTVTLPPTVDGRAQGLFTFRKLCEWKYLHERSWKPSPLMSRPYTQEEIDKLQDELDNRGGSKKENVHDIIKREKKKMRMRAVMDQKANSIADLAAVLQQQDDNKAEFIAAYERRETELQDSEVGEMSQSTDEAANGGHQKSKRKVDKRGRSAKKSNAQKPEPRSPENRYSSLGVTVEWADVFDAEYAEIWPEHVQHGPMGMTRHIAPEPGSKPARTLEEVQMQRSELSSGKAHDKRFRPDLVNILKQRLVRDELGIPLERRTKRAERKPVTTEQLRERQDANVETEQAA